MTRFDQWMAAALYGKKGYYTSKRTILGARGDFTTTPKLSSQLAEKLATEIDGPVIELGPGDGTLAHGIRNSLGFFKRRKLDYHLVEISPHLRERQKATLNGKGTWHPDLAAALKATGPHATILSNEFFDAFPVRIFRDGEELYLGEQNEEIWQPVDELPDSTLFKRDWPVGQRLEIHESIHQWFQTQLNDWQSGQMITIDYGGTAEEIYHRRPNGTLRAYAHHMRLYPPEAYQNPGHQDLTADINFDDIIYWGDKINIKTIKNKTQSEYLKKTNSHRDDFFRIIHQEKLNLTKKIY